MRIVITGRNIVTGYLLVAALSLAILSVPAVSGHAGRLQDPGTEISAADKQTGGSLAPDADTRTGGSPTLDVEATASFWWTIYEQVQNGLVQQGSGDSADDHASGFAFRHGRIGFIFGSKGGDLELLLRLRLEERTDIVDFYGGWLPSNIFRLYIGQMKVPSTSEVLAAYDDLDFASRSTFGRKVGDYSMTRTPYISSVMAAKSYDRDLGISVKGSWPGGTWSGEGQAVDRQWQARWFLMAGNGMGANRYIGGRESEEFLYTNSVGDMYFGGRLEISPIRWAKAGMHASSNRHGDMALGDRGPVMDIDRKAWSVDIAAGHPHSPRIYGFYGAGEMDDYFDAQRYLFDYSGWGLQGVWPFLGGDLELALRFDRFTSESGRDGNETRQDDWTAGINFSPLENLRLQLNYIVKTATSEFESDIDDDIFYLNFQFNFGARMVH
jgi:hypothetical protein